MTHWFVNRAQQGVNRAQQISRGRPAQGMAAIMDSPQWREEERPTTCHNCGKSLATAQAPHTIAGMAVCCPDCICEGKCACP